MLMWVITFLFSCCGEGDSLWEIYFWIDFSGKCTAYTASSQKDREKNRIAKKGWIGDREDYGQWAEDRSVYLWQIEAAPSRRS